MEMFPATLNEHSRIDVAIDGADQIDDDFNLVKGGGGALLREKMVEMASSTFIVIADGSKVVKNIGPGFPIPVSFFLINHVYISYACCRMIEICAQFCSIH
jgi:ribose 5-phosphate isomerase A